MKINKKIKRFRDKYKLGQLVYCDKYFIDTKKLITNEFIKKPIRTEVINFLLASISRETYYLEIGMRNIEDNFNKIKSTFKFSVDPCYEFETDDVDYKMTSDLFFEKLRTGEVLKHNFKFDVIFIDGLHLADQVSRDIENSLDFLSDDGYIVLHDCNPPTEWHAREEGLFGLSPAGATWNGTVWKAFFKQRFNESLSSACIDSDWGIGIISKQRLFSSLKSNFNPFFEFRIFQSNRKKSLNLISFSELKQIINKN